MKNYFNFFTHKLKKNRSHFKGGFNIKQRFRCSTLEDKKRLQVKTEKHERLQLASRYDGVNNAMCPDIIICKRQKRNASFSPNINETQGDIKRVVGSQKE